MRAVHAALGDRRRCRQSVGRSSSRHATATSLRAGAMPEEAANRVGGAPVARAPASTATLSCAPTPPLSELPKPALLNVFSRLAAEDLAALCLQERGLRDVVADAGDVELWAPLCAARWPGAALADFQTSGHYAGGWRQMYAARRGLPPAFLSCVDRCPLPPPPPPPFLP